MNKGTLISLSLVIMLALSACGGGSSSSDDGGSSEPILDASTILNEHTDVDQLVIDQDLFVSANITDADGMIRVWYEITGDNNAVLLSDEMPLSDVADTYTAIIPTSGVLSADTSYRITIYGEGVVEGDISVSSTSVAMFFDVVSDDSEIIVDPEPDTQAPVITLNGSSTVTLTVGDTYNELGATATDNEDPSVDVVISGSVDTDTVGTYTVTYTSTDTAGNTSNKTRTVIVNEVPNEAPTAVNDSFSTPHNTQLNGNVVTNDTDPESDAITVISNTNPSNGTLAMNSNGSFTYTPDTGTSGQDSFTYVVNGGDSATVTIDVAEAPIVAPNFTQEVYNTGVSVLDNTNDLQVILDVNTVNTGDDVVYTIKSVLVPLEGERAVWEEVTGLEQYLSLKLENGVLSVENLNNADPDAGGEITVEIEATNSVGVDTADVKFTFQNAY